MRQSGWSCKNILKTTEKPIKTDKNNFKNSKFTNAYLVPTIEVLDPMVLSSRVKEACECRECSLVQIPASICEVFDEDLVLCNETRRLYVSLGQFSIVRLERDAQLVVPMVEYSIPTKECCENPGCGEDPCEMFSRIPFPTEQFAPRNCDRQDCDCSGSG